MTYSIGLVPATPLDKGSVSDAASSPETARWFLVTPAIERALRNEPWFSYLLSGAVGWLDTFVRDQLPKRFYKIPSRAYPPR